MDVTCYPPQLRLMRPQEPNAFVETRFGVFFGSDGFALGGVVEAYHSVMGSLAKFTAAQKKRVRVSRHIQPWMEMFEREASLQKAKASYLADVQQQKRSSNPLTVPLYPYQYEGMLHLAFTGRAILADEMGLGKTVQAIAAAELLRQIGRVKRVLVVCPASLKSEWEEQYHFFTSRMASLLYGSRQARLDRYADKPAFLVVNYEQARSDVDDINRLYMPDLTILDEAQRIKNWPTKTAKTIKRIQSPYAFVLTGTPMENRIEELYSLAEFVNPHIFGSLFRFQREFMEPSAEGAVIPKNLDELHRRISSVMLLRRKHDVEDNLPERTDKNFFVPMTKEQLNRYKQDPECRIFLSSESGGSGLNLQAASVVINLDLPWNPAKLEQRIARAWRKNQKRHVQVINLVSENTIEHAMLGKLAYKQNLSDAVLDGKSLPESDRDYKTFVQRLAELMGQSTEAGAVASADSAAQADVLAPDAGEVVVQTRKTGESDEFMLARWPDRLVGVMRHRKRRSVLAIARNRDDAALIRDTVHSELSPEEPATVIDAETAELLKRLQEQGLIQMSPDLETLFGEPATTPPPKTVINLDRARAHWKTAARAVKAAKALLSVDLPDLAQPHMQEAVQTALASLRILHGVESDDPANTEFDAESFGENAALAWALYEQLVLENSKTQLSASAVQDLFSQVDKLLLEKSPL